jgi:RecA/RadA recombinase
LTEYLTTGSKNLDSLFGGGIATGNIYQLYGGPGSAKSEICYNISTLVSPEYKRLIICTGSKFRPERIERIAEANGLDVQRILKNTLLSTAADTDMLHHKIKSARSRIESDSTVRLLIVDSIIELYRAEKSYHKQACIPKRQHELSLDMFNLFNIAATKNVAVLITNQSIPDSLFWSRIIPTGGHMVSLLSNYIVYLKKHKSNRQYTKISARLIKPYTVKPDVTLLINSTGISDTPDYTTLDNSNAEVK